MVNSTLSQSSGLTVSAAVIDLAGAQKWSKTSVIDVAPDGVVRTFSIQDLADLSKTYFLSLKLADKGGAVLSQNFYWLSTVEDVLDWSKRDWYYTPPSVHGDFTALATLPPATLGVKTAFDHEGADRRAIVTLTNPGPSLAFFVRLRVLQKPGGAEILPSTWSDNYVSLLPGETRTLTARWRSEDAPGTAPAIAIDGWNVAHQ